MNIITIHGFQGSEVREIDPDALMVRLVTILFDAGFRPTLRSRERVDIVSDERKLSLVLEVQDKRRVT